VRVVRSTILAPEKTSFAFISNYGPVALSPDGRRMVFAATGDDGKSQLWMRPLDSASAQLLPGTDGARFPFWAPDSRWLAFFSDRKLKKMDTAGGPPTVLSAAPNAPGGSWSRNGVIVFANGAPRRRSPRWRRIIPCNCGGPGHGQQPSLPLVSAGR
jgi:Tol biopolymer transport system component